MTQRHTDLTLPPQDSPEFAELATSVFAYLDRYGLTEAQKALNTMKETANVWSEFKNGPES